MTQFPDDDSEDKAPRPKRRARRRLYESPDDSAASDKSSDDAAADAATDDEPAGESAPRKKAASSRRRSSARADKQKGQKEASGAAEAVAENAASGAAEAVAENAAGEVDEAVAGAAADSESARETVAEEVVEAVEMEGDSAATSMDETSAGEQATDNSGASQSNEKSTESAPKTDEIPVVEAKMMPLTPAEERRRLRNARALVKQYCGWSAGAGLVPIPVLDVAALTVVQVKMLRRLTRLYGLKFSENDGKTYVSSLLSSLTATSLGVSAAGRGLMFFSGIGRLVGFLAMPVFAAAFTWAVGRIFIYHYESGGSFFSFDPEKMTLHFRELYKDASTISERWKREAQEEAESQ